MRDLYLILLGVFIDRLYNYGESWVAAYRIKKKYKNLVGMYRMLREGTPTGGSVELVQNNNGTFKTIARNADNTIQWEGQIQMSADEDNVGTGSYRYSSLSANRGTQTVMYMPEVGHSM